MTIEQYLQGKVDFNLTDANIQAILYDRGVAEGANMSAVTEMQKDLCLADLYMLLANSSVSSSGEYESDGGGRGRYRQRMFTIEQDLSHLQRLSTISGKSPLPKHRAR